MTCPPARIEHNSRNAQKSTGPRTEVGQAQSRLNAFRHGPAGAGGVLGPTDDAREVDVRAAEIAEELGARGRTGRILARRAAAMSLRLEQAEEHALVASAVRAHAARDEFDADRQAGLEGLVADLEAADNPRRVLAELEGSPEGVRFLDGSWTEILQALRTGGDDGRARRWLGIDEPVAPAALIGRSEAELARLRRLAAELDATAGRAIAGARYRAGVLASFDASVEGERARRHEAAAERSLHRALRAIAEHRAALADRPSPAIAPAATPPPAADRPAPAPTRAAAVAAFGSFPAAVAALGSFPIDGVDDFLDLMERRTAAPGTPEARRKRPNLDRIRGGRR